MKKTVNANIAGTVFHIEEDAYEQLQRYLAGIRANFSGSPGAVEIMADIEARIAELFTERLTGRNVVTLADVQHVESVMGRPEDFAAEGHADAVPDSGTGSPRGSKRFMRDPDDKWIGGVCGGLGAYIGMDPLWLRIALIVLVYFSVGSLIPVYILLWILVPKARTAPERLQMRGEPVNVENIKRVVEEGAEKIKQGGERMADEAKDLGREWAPKARAWGQEAGRSARSAGNSAAHVIGKLIGVALILIAFGLLLGLATGFIGGTWSVWSASWTSDDFGLLDMGGLLFSSRQHALWLGIGVFTLLAIPVISLLLAGFHLLLNTRTPKWLGWSLAVLWFAALVPTVIAGVDLGVDFFRHNSVRSELPITQPTDGLLYLDALMPKDSSLWSLHYDDGERNVDFDGFHVENGTVRGAWAELDVEQSPDSLYHLVVVRDARARTTKTALSRATNIQVEYDQDGDVLLVSPVFSYPASDKFRAQNAHFTLEVPVGGSVFFRKGSRDVINDIDNVTNTLDHDMLGRAWTMTPRGLEDLRIPRKLNDTKDTIPPAHAVKTGPVAAVVLPAPSRRKAAKPAGNAVGRRTAVTDEGNGGVQLPNLVNLFTSILALH